MCGRFTDFLVNEIDQDGNVIHLKNIGHPDPSATPVDGSNDSTTAPEASTHAATAEAPLAAETTETAPTPKIEEDDEGWSEKFTARLSQFLSFELVAQLKQIYLEGPEPPRISDAGWAGRTAQKTVDSEELPLTKSDDGLPERFGKRGRGRDKRGGRDGREGGGRNSGRQDNRKVVSDVSVSRSLVPRVSLNTLHHSLSIRRRLARNCIKRFESYSRGSWIVKQILLP